MLEPMWNQPFEWRDCDGVTWQNSSKRQVSFKYDPSDCIRQEGDRFLLDRGDRRYVFTSDGCLLEINRNGLCLARFDWENGRIAHISNDFNHAYSLQYDTSEEPRIIGISASNGTHIEYTYHQSGLLAAAQSHNKCIENYLYDLQDRLTEVRDNSGRVSRQTCTTTLTN